MSDLYTVADFVSDALDVSKTETSTVLNQSPLVAQMPITDTADGSETHKYNVYTQAPVVGFRAANTGRAYDHSVDTVATSTCTILDFSFRVDYAVAQAWRQGPENLIAREGLRHLAAALFKVEQQIFYGVTTPGDASGFAGLLGSSNYDALADPMVTGAGGTTASVQSSVWGLRLGEADLKLVTPMDRGIVLGETIITEANDDTTNGHPVYYTPGALYIGLQLGSTYSAGRIANLNGPTDSKGLTDDLISDLISEFPNHSKPTIICANRESIRDLQQSRTATNMTGRPADFPAESFGYPVLTCESLVQTEAVET